MLKSILAAFVVTLALGQSAQAITQLPPGVFAGTPNYKLAPAGTYAVDPGHTAVIAKVSHIGYSLSVFRFDKVSGTLHWDPKLPIGSSLSVSVDTASISTPVPGFAAQLAGKEWLNSAAFPQASFVSTHVRQIDSTHGLVEGQFTLLGKTLPLTFKVELVGAGKGFMGHPRIGMEAVAHIKPAAFGLSPMLGKSVLLVIDAEFAQNP